MRRLLAVLSTVAVVAPVVALTTAPAEAGPAYEVSVPSRFSPNDDGVQDTLRVRFTVPKPTRVRLEIVGSGRGGGTVDAVDLGWRRSGTYTWTWDGRNARGRLVGDGLYYVRLVIPNGSGRAADRVLVDTTFEPELTTPAYGLESPRPRVFPRSTEVADAVQLTAYTQEKRLSSMRVVIRNARGKVVREADADDELVNNLGYRSGYGRTVPWAAQRGGKALPSGRYTAVVTGRDGAGNLGTSDPLKIWVSADTLVWKEVTTTVAAGTHTFGSCTYTPSSGCSDFHPCGQVVASQLFPGGQSYVSKPCADPTSSLSVATSSHLLEYPEATGLRGVGAVRVAFEGAPTTAGETDTGTISIPATDGSTGASFSGTSGRTAWVEHPFWGEGMPADEGVAPALAPAAVWDFATRGTDSVDVASFTVDVRYLAVEE